RKRNLQQQSALAKSVLSEGRWVKIAIDADGMYRLTRKALQAMGFNKPENVHLYGYGGHRQKELIKAGSHHDDLPEEPLYYNAQRDEWLFWGNGLLYWDGNKRIVNNFAREACYFLREEAAPSTIETLSRETGTPIMVRSTVTDHDLYEKDEFAWAPYGRNLYDGINFLTAGSRSYQLHSINSQGDETLEVVFSAAANTTTTVKTTVNGQTQKTFAIAPLSKYTYGVVATQNYNVHALKQSDTWDVTLASTSGNNARLDYLALHYTRPLALHDGYVAFSSATNVKTQFNVTGSGWKVLRVGEPGSPTSLVETTQEGGNMTLLTTTPTRRFVAFDPAYEFSEPRVVGDIANQNLHALDSLDMVIIVPTSGRLTEQATRLAEAHAKHDGLRAAVVRADQIYNEFSSGTPDATAYRRLLKMLYDRHVGTDAAPRYLLLMGDCAWDNRMV
ncbi:MAG: hypothetical protein HUK03_10205, partial [Bacteroidaceae bacterium]|nr:hypothetical protein [Bacteroidaceae bacterium]